MALFRARLARFFPFIATSAPLREAWCSPKGANLETIGRDLEEMQRTPLTPAHVDAMRSAETVATYETGAYFAQQGHVVDRFVYVLESEIEVVNPFSGERGPAGSNRPVLPRRATVIVYGPQRAPPPNRNGCKIRSEAR